MEWCTIESDPAVFSELLEEIGVKDVAVHEVYSLDDKATLANLGHIYGFIFLFKYMKTEDNRTPILDSDPELYFSRQVVVNACGTQALLSVIMNAPGMELGKDLNEFREFSMALDPESRGFALGELDVLRKAHNSFAKPEPFHIEQSKYSKGGEAFHFVAYVPFKSHVYELDGLKAGPIDIGEFQGDSWVDVAAKEIQRRIEL